MDKIFTLRVVHGSGYLLFLGIKIYRCIFLDILDVLLLCLSINDCIFIKVLYKTCLFRTKFRQHILDSDKYIYISMYFSVDIIFSGLLTEGSVIVLTRYPPLCRTRK